MVEGCEFCGRSLPDPDGGEAEGWDSLLVPVVGPRGAVFFPVHACPGCQAGWGLVEEAGLARVMGMSVEELRAGVGGPAGRVITFAEVAGRSGRWWRGVGAVRRRPSGEAEAAKWDRIGSIARVPDLATLLRMADAIREQGGDEGACQLMDDVVDALFQLRVLARAEGDISAEAVLAATRFVLRDAGLMP